MNYPPQFPDDLSSIVHNQTYLQYLTSQGFEVQELKRIFYDNFCARIIGHEIKRKLEYPGMTKREMDKKYKVQMKLWKLDGVDCDVPMNRLNTVQNRSRYKSSIQMYGFQIVAMHRYLDKFRDGSSFLLRDNDSMIADIMRYAYGVEFSGKSVKRMYDNQVQNYKGSCEPIM